MDRHGSTTDVDPFLTKESLNSLAKIGFGKRRPRLGPHRYHGIAARTRLSVAGKVTSLANMNKHNLELGCRDKSKLCNLRALRWENTNAEGPPTQASGRLDRVDLTLKEIIKNHKLSFRTLTNVGLPDTPLATSQQWLKCSMVSTSEQRRQHHKERVTINQVTLTFLVQMKSTGHSSYLLL